jgi:hypothetical protein
MRREEAEVKGQEGALDCCGTWSSFGARDRSDFVLSFSRSSSFVVLWPLQTGECAPENFILDSDIKAVFSEERLDSHRWNAL